MPFKKLFKVLFSKNMPCAILQIVSVSLIQYSLTDSVIIKTIVKMVPMKIAQGDFQISFIFVIYNKSLSDSLKKDLISDHFENHF